MDKINNPIEDRKTGTHYPYLGTNKTFITKHLIYFTVYVKTAVLKN